MGHAFRHFPLLSPDGGQDKEIRPVTGWLGPIDPQAHSQDHLELHTEYIRRYPQFHPTIISELKMGRDWAIVILMPCHQVDYSQANW